MFAASGVFAAALLLAAILLTNRPADAGVSGRQTPDEAADVVRPAEAAAKPPHKSLADLAQILQTSEQQFARDRDMGRGGGYGAAACMMLACWLPIVIEPFRATGLAFAATWYVTVPFPWPLLADVP